MRLTGRIHIVNRADEFILTRVPRIGEIETALWIQSQIIRPTQWLAIALLGCMLQRFTISIQVQNGMLARIANQMGTIGKYLMAVGGSRHCKVLVRSIELKLR